MNKKSRNETVATRLSSETKEWLVRNFASAGNGMYYCVETMRFVSETIKIDPHNMHDIVEASRLLKLSRQYSIRELKGVFTVDELCFFADSLNGTMITAEFRFNAGALIAHTEDSEAFDGLSSKWDVNIAVMIEKINKLPSSAIDALYCEVERFWDNSDTLKINEWAEKLA